MKMITKSFIDLFITTKRDMQLSENTLNRYNFILNDFVDHLDGGVVDNSKVLAYVKDLKAKYKPNTTNLYIIVLNDFFNFLGYDITKIKTIKIQNKNELTDLLSVSDLRRLLRYSNDKYKTIFLTMFYTGIRVSELKFITQKSIKNNKIVIDNKGKIRHIMYTKKLKSLLRAYIKNNDITTNIIFDMDTSTIRKYMKKLSGQTKIKKTKCYPHNIRHLFAIEFMKINGNITELSQILGHNSINTTMIYAKNTPVDRKISMERLEGLI